MASKFLDLDPEIIPQETFSFGIIGDTLSVNIRKEFILTKGFNNSNYLYYHFENSDGVLEQYWLVDVYQKKAAVININDYNTGVIRAHYKGFTLEYKIE